MALDQVTILNKIYQRELNLVRMNVLAKQRAAEEAQLVIDYKVNECNQARAAIQLKYAVLIKPYSDANAVIAASILDDVSAAMPQ